MAIRGSTLGQLLVILPLTLALLLPGCGGDEGGGAGEREPDSEGNDTLESWIEERNLTGDPASRRGLSGRSHFPDEDPVAKLGQLLFFSQTLSGGFDAACASCHHPDFAFADGLSLAVGVASGDRGHIGPGRRVRGDRDQDPLADGGPNSHRNSQTTANAALYDRVLFRDGRIFILDDETAAGGKGQSIRTPESGSLPSRTEGDGLLGKLSRFPLVSDNEMRGFFYPGLADPVDYRKHLMQRLRNEVDTQYLQPAGSPNDWLSRFQAAFGEDASAEELITIDNVEKALAVYMETQIFVDTPWRDYVQGEKDSLSEKAEQGARLFLATPDQGGLGCSGCHSGDRFTDEQFYNVGFPQIGRGFRSAERDDTGRWRVTRDEQDWYAFRTPGLLNVAETAPYGHTGTFATLEGLLRYHADPEEGVEEFFSRTDFLSHLSQFDTLSVDYDHAEEFTRRAINHPSFERARQKLPNRSLSNSELEQLEAFLRSLTDRCVADPDCIGQWAPDMDEDPDGHLLVRDQVAAAPDIDDGNDQDNESQALAFPGLPVRDGFMELDNCSGENLIGDAAANSGQKEFALRSEADAFGLTHPHGFGFDTWLGSRHGIYTELAMFSGGVTATYLDDDCWPDLVYTGGEASGVQLYLNETGQNGFASLPDAFVEDPGNRHTGVAAVDINGDYRRELFFGNLTQGDSADEAVPVFAPDGDLRYTQVGALPTARPTFGISFGDINGDGWPELYMAHWASIGVAGSAPALWLNEKGEALKPYDEQAKTSSKYVNQEFNFVPAFADLTGNGRQDLLIASDFNTSQALENRRDSQGKTYYENVTDRDVFTDENGMGSVLGDFSNDGRLEWFVTSVYDPNGEAEGNWGVTGNRLYRNTSAETGGLSFEDITDSTGDLRDGNWGWGACAADFNNDGLLDIVQVNGFGFMPESLYGPGDDQEKRSYYQDVASEFIGTTPRLLINNGDGSFTNEAAEWGLDYPSEGRGVSCLDYDRDGDMDIVLLDHSSGLRFFENRVGHGPSRGFLNIRLVGERPNTEALGARVYVDADPGRGLGTQQMMRVAQANNNFNSQSLPNLHFGVGYADNVDVTVIWPDGGKLACEDVARNQFLVLDEREGTCPP